VGSGQVWPATLAAGRQNENCWAVVVSVVHVQKGEWRGGFELNVRPVEKITAYLFHDGGHDNPRPLCVNLRKSFIGHFISGPGFTFDDSEKTGATTPISLQK
jgi:hypothetical protein